MITLIGRLISNQVSDRKSVHCCFLIHGLIQTFCSKLKKNYIRNNKLQPKRRCGLIVKLCYETQIKVFRLYQPIRKKVQFNELMSVEKYNLITYVGKKL